MQEHFKDKVCVVTGAASGMGLQLSKDLLAAGAIVSMADVDAGALERARAGLDGGRSFAVTVDVSDAEQVRAMIERATAWNGRLDILFNNAGIGATMPWEELTLDTWRRVIDIDLWGVIHGLHFAVPIMRRQGGGHIVDISSVGGLLAIPYQAAYCACKAAVASIGECLRFELAHEGIHVTTVYPSNVATPIFSEAGAVPDDAVSVEEASAIILRAVAARESMVVFPESARLWAEEIQRDAALREKTMLDMAAERRHNYQTKGRYF
ncbi:MAG: SDR family NAD(P)-dependent oxidoreductase [Synergistaceae bacterium]|nr:SDR family NAD(P)-dependent oxidoreductase [Synergistaceae bacterium]